MATVWACGLVALAMLCMGGSAEYAVVEDVAPLDVPAATSGLLRQLDSGAKVRQTPPAAGGGAAADQQQGKAALGEGGRRGKASTVRRGGGPVLLSTIGSFQMGSFQGNFEETLSDDEQNLLLGEGLTAASVVERFSPEGRKAVEKMVKHAVQLKCPGSRGGNSELLRKKRRPAAKKMANAKAKKATAAELGQAMAAEVAGRKEAAEVPFMETRALKVNGVVTSYLNTSQALYVAFAKATWKGTSGAGVVVEVDGNEMRKMVATHPSSNADFGSKMLLWGSDRLIIAAPGETVDGKSHAGAVYVTAMTKGKAEKKMERIVATHPSSLAEFGSKVLLWGSDRLIIANPRETVDGKSGAGAVYVTAMTKGKAEKKMERIVSPTVVGGSGFGFGLDVLDGGRLLAIHGKKEIPTSYLSRSDPSRKVHSLATSTGGSGSKALYFKGKLLVATQTHLTEFQRATLMPFRAAAARIFDRYVGSDGAVHCQNATRDKRIQGYFAQWTTDPYGKDSASPPIKGMSSSSKNDQLTFLKKTKTIKATKDHKGGTLTKTMFCVKRGRGTKCCVGKDLEANRPGADDAAALTPALQLW